MERSSRVRSVIAVTTFGWIESVFGRKRTRVSKHVSRMPKPFVAAVMALCLLVPLLYGFLPVVQPANTACGMTCCKHARHCSRAAKLESVPAGLQWNASSCPNHCKELPALRSMSAPAFPVARMAATSVQTEAAALPSATSPFRAGTDFVLFQRPPPSFNETRSCAFV